jgi:hypothetical protein
VPTSAPAQTALRALPQQPPQRAYFGTEKLSAVFDSFNHKRPCAAGQLPGSGDLNGKKVSANQAGSANNTCIFGQ